MVLRSSRIHRSIFWWGSSLHIERSMRKFNYRCIVCMTSLEFDTLKNCRLCYIHTNNLGYHFVLIYFLQPYRNQCLVLCQYGLCKFEELYSKVCCPWSSAWGETQLTWSFLHRVGYKGGDNSDLPKPIPLPFSTEIKHYSKYFL